MHLRLAVAVALSVVAAPALALGLGPAQLRSSLGQPLHVEIPVNAANVDDVGCVTVTTSADLPMPSTLHNRVTTTGSGAILVDLTSTLPVGDPAVGFTLSAGCTSAVSRSYVLFLDPPAVIPDLAATAPTYGAPVADQGAPVAAPRRRRRAPSAAGDGAATVPNNAVGVRTHETATAIASRVPVPVQRKPRAPAVSSFTPIAAPSDAATGDRFHLSNDLGTDLRLADELGTPDAQPIDAPTLQALKDERARLAAILAAQDPNSVSTTRETELQNRVNSMGSDIAALRQQLAAQAAHAKQVEESRAPSLLTWIFGAIALLALLVAGWFGWRHRRAQVERADQPWWEQTQIAPQIAERSASAADNAFGNARRDPSALRPAAPVEPEVVDHDTFVKTTRVTVAPPAPAPIATPATAASLAAGAAAAAAAKAAIPLKESGPSALARGPETVPMVPAPAAPAPFVAAPPPAPMMSPLSPSMPVKSSYSEDKSIKGGLDERIDSAVPKPLDFNLDLPPVTTNLGRDEKGVAATGSLGAAPATERPTALAPLDFELPVSATRDAAANEGASGMGPDTILRLDEAAIGGAAPPPVANTAEAEAEQASVQFRLIQFASVVEQAEELERNQEPTKAIATLRQYVLRDETIPTLMWLMLFALYKQVNKRPVYDALGEHFSRRYKRPMARWDESLQSIAPQTPLASLPELDAAIRAKWGTQAGIEMLRSLTCGRDQPNEIIYNAVLQRDLLQMAKVFPLSDTI